MLKSSKRASRAAVVQRHFTKEGVDPLDGVKWVSASSALTNPSGEVLALREGLEAPKDWSQLAVDIAAMKYFRRAGLHGDAKKGETSVRQLIHRLANTIRGAGERWGYFRDATEASAFEAELSYMLVNQIGAFNSPVWFNCGLFQQYGIAGEGGNWAWDPTLGHPVETGNAYERPQCSACFIQGVDDSLMSIFELVKNEARLFKYGSGTGSNFSALRGRQEKLSGGGTSSGLMSFLEVLDRAAGATKSGGTTRRAAKMVCLNVDHPEILDFVRWKSREEKKAQALIAAGYPADFNGEAYHTVSGQNSNNSVRVTDEFMRAVEQDGAWETRARTTGAVCETFPARELWEEIGKAAWSCADPGVQYDSTINDWHTCPNSGRINASNPCCFVGETLVDTSEGRIPIEALEMLSVAGLPLPLSFSFDVGDRLPVLRQIKKVWRSGEAATLVEVKTDKGVVVRCTPEHRFLTYAGEYVEARDLKAGQRLRKIGRGELAGRVTMQHRGTERYPDGCSYMSRWMWEQVNGPIPEGHHIHHVNGDPRDNRISNLECVEGTRHHSDHAKGLDNPRAYGLPFEKLAEVWEAVSAADHGRKSKIGKVTVCRWNKYVKDNGLAGAVPYSNGSLQGVPLDQFAKMVEDYRQDVNDRVESVTPITLPSPVPVYDMEVEGVHNFSVASPGISHSVVVHNSEYMFLDDTACNLSSLNLTKFLVEGADGSLRFDIEGYRHAARVFFLAQEILVDFSSYPTKTIAQNSHDYRPLGLGYANLGTLLMVLGIAYDSPEGRSMAAALTAILTGQAYLVSAEVASIKGAFAGYAANREPMLRVMRKHRDAAFALDQALIDGRPSTLGGELAAAASDDWDSAVVHGERHGYRNAQATVLAPTGCLVAGSLVMTDQGLARIETLGNPEGEKWQDIDLTVSTDDGPRRATKFYVNGVDDVIEVRTTSGHILRGTPKHQIKVVREGRWEWTRFGALEGGETVPLAMGGMVGTPRSVPLPPCPPSYRSNGYRGIRTPEAMTAELAELVGAFAANGSLHEKGLRLSMFAGDGDATEKYRGSFRDLFGVESSVRECGEYVSVEINSSQIASWWGACGFAKTPGDKPGKGFTPRVPDAIFVSNDPAVYGAYLRGLFTCDGTVNVGCPSLSNKDSGFISDVQTMLLALGVPTKRDRQTGGWSGKDVWRIGVASRIFNRVFQETVGFSASRKIARVQFEGDWSRADFIPLTKETLDEACPVGHPLRKGLVEHFHARGAIPRHTARRLDHPAVRHLLGFYYETVESAELVGREPTYDLSVPDNVTYIANGFVSHNTIGLLMDCDTTGIEPDFALVKFKKLAGGGYFKIVNASVERALGRLGYSKAQIAEILAYVVGTNTFLGAPVVNREYLKGKGFTNEDITRLEGQLPGAFTVEGVFSAFGLGADLCKRLGLEEAAKAPGWNLLAHWGLTRAQIDLLGDTLLGRMTVEGAPHLRDEHLPVFDCANRCGKHGTRYLKPMSHVQMMAAVQPFLSGAISKCVVGDTMVITDRGMMPIRSLYRGESPDTFRKDPMGVASEAGTKTAVEFYYGGERPVLRVKLGDGRELSGTPNHQVRVGCAEGYLWRRLDELQPGDYVAIRLGANMWSSIDADLSGFRPSPGYGTQKTLGLPPRMTQELGWLLGAYIADGNKTHSNWTVRITKNDSGVLKRAGEVLGAAFGVDSRISEDPRNGVTSLLVRSKTLCEWLDFVGASGLAAEKQIPWAVLQSTRETVAAFVGGLWLDGYVAESIRGLAISLASPKLVSQLQTVLDNFGVRSVIGAKVNHERGQDYPCLYVTGPALKMLAGFVRLDQAHKQEALARFAAEDRTVSAVWSDVMPCYRAEMAEAIRTARATTDFRNVLDTRTRNVSWETAARVDRELGVPELGVLIENGIHFTPVRSISEGSEEVFDFHVPDSNAFLGNGVVNHNTVNLPNEATVEEVMDVYTQGWKLGLKAVALYRDGCKASQPLSTSGKDDKTEKEDKAKGEAEVRAAAVVDAPPAPPAAPVAVSARPTVRYRLPARRRGFTQEAKIGGHKVFLRTGEYGDGQLGEIFIDMHKEGAAFRSLMNSFAIAVSMGLQHGVPLQAYVDMFTFTRFEPQGSVVGHANVKYATSIIDYVFRALGVEYLKRYDLAHVLPEGDGDAPDPAPYAAPAAPEVSASNQHLGKMMGDAPMCDVCGHITVRNGTCYRCHNCGNSMGCS